MGTGPSFAVRCGTTPITPAHPTVAGLVVQIFVQVSCQESIG